MAGSRRRKPLIGVTGPDRGGLAAWYFTRFAVWRAGGKARHITPSRPCSIYGLDGLIIGGGADVDPGLYGAAPEHFMAEMRERHKPLAWYLMRLVFFPLVFLIRKLFSTKSACSPDRGRDQLETGLLEESCRKGLPVLGICRGAQLLNVVHGGTLYQQLDEFYVETPQVRTILPKKTILVDLGTKLAVMLQCRECHVNALHRQAVKDLGHGLRVAAREATGVIQAIEHRERPYLLGVQWHPEYLPQQKEQLAIFQALVIAARAGCGWG